MHTKTKTASIAIISIVYLIAFFVGYLVFTRLKGDMSELWALFVADVVATVVVWWPLLLCGSSGSSSRTCRFTTPIGAWLHP